MLFLSVLKGLWSGSEVGLDTSNKRSQHRFSNALALNPVPPLNNSSNACTVTINSNTCSVTVISIYHLELKCVLLCLAESAPNFLCT